MLLLDDLEFNAPAPELARGAHAQTTGVQGIQVLYYWVIIHYPVGRRVTGPLVVRNAPDTLTPANAVRIVWGAALGAMRYDVLRTDVPEFPEVPGLYALTLGTATTVYLDEGQPLQAYDPLTLLPWGAPVTCHIHLNNRDYSRPTLEMPCQIRVSRIVYPDGSSQTTAGAGGSGPELVAGTGITLVPGPDTLTINAAVWSVFGRTGAIVAQTGDYTAAQVTNAVSTLGSYADPAWITSLAWSKITGTPSAAQISLFQTPWLSNINGGNFNLTNVGRIGIGTASPAYPLDVVGDIHTSGCVQIGAAPMVALCNDGSGNLLVNGVPITGGTTVGATPPASPVQGQFWFDSVSTQLFVWYNDGTSGQWVVAVNETGLLRDAPNDGKVYARQNQAWVEIPASAAGVTVADTPPASPAQGSLWFDSVSTQLFVWYYDGTSGQWVVAINESGLLRDAPADGKLYGRQSGAWVEVTGGGGGGGPWTDDVDADGNDLINLGCIVFGGTVPASICTDDDGCIVFSDENGDGQAWLDQHAGLHLGAHREFDWSPGLIPAPGMSITSHWPVIEMAGDNIIGQLRFVDMQLTGNTHSADITVGPVTLGAPVVPRDQAGSEITFGVREKGAGMAPRQAMVINHLGYVGINTSLPTYRLDVNGDCNLSASHVYRINGVPISFGATVSNTAPSPPSLGQFWFEPVSQDLYLWDGTQWTAIGTGGGGGGMNQTPWLSNINGAGHDLSNVNTIDVTDSYSIDGVQFATVGP